MSDDIDDTTTPHDDEKRRTPRITTRGSIPAQLAVRLEAKVLDLSSHGMRIELPFRPWLGQTYQLIVLLEGRFVPVTGVVRDVQALTDDLNAVGIEITDVAEPDRLLLDRLVGATADPRSVGPETA